jgi:hypothetical protein
MKMNFISKIFPAILALALLLMPAVPVSASSLTSGYVKLKDWDKTNQAFSFSAGQVTVGSGDFFIAPRGIHVFESPGIIDMGLKSLNDIVEAPTSGYVEMATPIDGHSYVVRSKGKYSKFYIEETYDWLNPVEYGITWVCQIDGTRSFKDATTAGQPAATGQPETEGKSGCTYEQYMAAYNKLTSLMSQGKGDTPQGKDAYEQFAKIKACYESSASGTNQSAAGQTGTGGGYECPQDKAEAYQQYLAAYNKLNYLVSHGEEGTPQAKLAYEQYVKTKTCYESKNSGPGQPTDPAAQTAPTPTPTPTTPPSTSPSVPSTNPLMRTISKLCPLSAAYGSPEAPELLVFRQFRDKVLAKHPAGTAVINVYYHCSPSFVEIMTYYDILQPVVRYCLAEPAAAILHNTNTIWNN